LGVCFCALNITVYGQETPTARAAAFGGDISRTTIVIIPQEKVEELVRDVKRLREGLTTQQRENVALLRKKLDLNEGQVLATLDKRGEIALARLRYVEAATHFAKAAGVFPPGSTYKDRRIGYLVRQAASLHQQGEEFEDNGALRLAIELYKRVIDRNSRERVPLQWAAIQNNLGNALRVLGNRESGTVTLEEAVGAYREALKELNRE